MNSRSAGDTVIYYIHGQADAEKPGCDDRCRGRSNAELAAPVAILAFYSALTDGCPPTCVSSNLTGPASQICRTRLLLRVHLHRDCPTSPARLIYFPVVIQDMRQEAIAAPGSAFSPRDTDWRDLKRLRRQ